MLIQSQLKTKSQYVECVLSHIPCIHVSYLEQGEFAKRSVFFFNCTNSTSHTSRLCKSKIQCQVPWCGKTHHTLLHRSTPPFTKTAGTVEIGSSTQDLAHSAHFKCMTDVLLQVIPPLKIVNSYGKVVTTYG